MVEETNEATLPDLMAAFFKNPGEHFDALAEMVSDFDCEKLENFDELQSLVPVGGIVPDECHVCITEFDQAPYLFVTRAPTKLVAGEHETDIAILTRRVAMIAANEEEIFEWVCDFSQTDPIKNDEGNGNHSWQWTLPKSTNVIGDGYRLFVAPKERMFLLDRISTIRG